MFCTSVSGYRYIRSKFITASITHNRESDMIGGAREKELCVILTMFLLCSKFMIMLSYLKYFVFCTHAYVAFVFCTHVAFISF